jgi:hypothetical protein
MVFNRKHWIRRDRDEYFLFGVMLTACIASVVSLYWHAADRINVKRSILMQAAPAEAAQEAQGIRESGYLTPSETGGAPQYYKMEEAIRLPNVPDPAKDKNGE